ncbi:MAG: hypothetical protein HY904_23135 [Deltaproteobacteria bacterium]|nr:hypothetical protein [Deltaproteobacteria bacterium]
MRFGDRPVDRFFNAVHGDDAFLKRTRAAIWLNTPQRIADDAAPDAVVVAVGWPAVPPGSEPQVTYGRLKRLPAELVDAVRRGEGEVMFAHHDLPEEMRRQFEDELGWQLELPGQLNGWTYAEEDEIPRSIPAWRPAMALHAQLGLKPGEPGEYLVLVPVDDRWYVLSERGLRTYSFGAWLADGEVVRFQRFDGGTPRVLRLRHVESIPHAQVAPQFGAAAAERARDEPDAPSIVVKVEPEHDA